MERIFIFYLVCYGNDTGKALNAEVLEIPGLETQYHHLQLCLQNVTLGELREAIVFSPDSRNVCSQAWCDTKYHGVTPSTMVFQHCTSNTKFYFEAFFRSNKYLISPFFRNKQKHRGRLKVIFFSVVDHEIIYMWEMNDISHQGNRRVTPPL